MNREFIRSERIDEAGGQHEEPNPRISPVRHSRCRREWLCPSRDQMPGYAAGSSLWTEAYILSTREWSGKSFNEESTLPYLTTDSFCHIPMVSSSGRLVGIVSQCDILRYMAPEVRSSTGAESNI